MTSIKLTGAVLLALLVAHAQGAQVQWATPQRDTTITVSPAGEAVQLRGNATQVEPNDSTAVQPSTLIVSPSGGRLRVETVGSVASHDFGSILVGKESGRFSATLSNAGDQAISLVFNGYSGDSEAFRILEDCPESLPVGGSCRMELWFVPNAAATYAAALTLTMDAVLSASYSFAVKGNGYVEGYGWKADSWSVCSSVCGVGTQMRAVWCERSDGTHVEASACTAGTRPLSSQSCENQGACQSYEWAVGSWGACAGPCGSTGTRTRTASCVDAVTGRVADSSLCTWPAPAISQACAVPVCGSPTYHWEAGAFSSCPAAASSCPAPESVQAQTCVRNDGQQVPESFCLADPGAGPKPVVTQPCACVAMGSCTPTTIQRHFDNDYYMCGNTREFDAAVTLPPGINGQRIHTQNYVVAVYYQYNECGGVPYACAYVTRTDPNYALINATCTNGTWQLAEFATSTPLGSDGQCPSATNPPVLRERRADPLGWLSN